QHVARVIAELSRYHIQSYKDCRAVGHYYLPEPDKWHMSDQGVDFIYTGRNPVTFMLPNGLREIIDADVWETLADRTNKHPLFGWTQYQEATAKDPVINFVQLDADDLDESLKVIVRHDPTAVLVVSTHNAHAMAAIRRMFFELVEDDIDVPVVIRREYAVTGEDAFMIDAATDIGGLYIDGFGDGVMLGATPIQDASVPAEWIDRCNRTAFGILQATRNRMSKTEYISCPSCGRTLFDLQETTAMIRKRTDHLKGIKIGIMGCIVNGPGEMADADYGYVGSGPGRITLYRGKEIVRRNVPAAQAVDQLIELIREDGNWIDPQSVPLPDA